MTLQTNGKKSYFNTLLRIYVCRCIINRQFNNQENAKRLTVLDYTPYSIGLSRGYMVSKEELLKAIEFSNKLKANTLEIPNDFTEGLGKLVKKARDEKGYSQAKLAKILNRRQATISSIENGKSEIGILTLVHLSISLQKPISFFIPGELIHGWVSEIQNPLEEEALHYVKAIEYEQGDIDLAMSLLKLVYDRIPDPSQQDKLPDEI